jgi:hypothetical protein
MTGNLIWRILLTAFIALIARSAYYVGSDVYYTAQSTDWPSTEGEIIKIVNPSKDPQPKSWAKDKIVEYKYLAEGKEFSGNKISFNRRKKWYGNDVTRLVAPLSLGDGITVFYNPKNAAISVLNPGGSNTANVAFLCAQILGITMLATALSWSIFSSNKGDG